MSESSASTAHCPILRAPDIRPRARLRVLLCAVLAPLVMLVPPAVLAQSSDALAAAREQLLDGDYAGGIERYRAVLESDVVADHPEALEYLGVAYEKSGRQDQALTRYREYLQRFPDAPGSARVRQRFAALEATIAQARAPRQPPRVADQVAGIADPAPEPGPAARPAARSWDWFGGISQDLWLDSYEIDGVDNAIERSQILTFANLGLQGQTDRLDVQARLDAGYLHTLSGYDDRDLNQVHVHRAFVGVEDEPTGLGLQAGRMSQFQDGVLGRFDGARGSWRWRERTSVHVTAGMPVDSPRFQGDTRRPFVTFAAAREGLLDQFDVRAFFALRQVEGASDREAVGGEVRWRRDRWQVMANLDYDLSYQTLNSVFAHAQFAVNDRLRLFARVQSYALPFITTGNALIGQPLGSIDDLADSTVLSDAQLRTVARDRTADVWQGTGGLSWSLSQRWHANGSITYIDSDASVDSVGVAARPRRQEFFTRFNLIGSSVLRPADTLLVGYQLQSTTTADTNTLRFELRLPFGRPFGGALRINPLLNVGFRDAVAAGDQQFFLEPGLRAVFRYAKRYRLEFLGRGRWTDRDLPASLRGTGLYEDDQVRSAAYFLQLGWRVDL
ncbi:MAG: hypothetical protein AAGI15_10155 [Pseudomonadota bacterium]